VVSTRQLAQLGYTRSSASKAHGVGRLRRVHRGVYAVGHTDLKHKGRVMAAALACQPAVVSHWTAGWLHGLFKTSSTFELTAPTERRPRKPFSLHFASLAPEDITVIDGIPATSVFRTLLDLAPYLTLKRLRQLLARTEELKAFDLPSFDALLSRTGGHRGNRPLRKALRAYRPDPAVTRSDLERDFRRLVRRARLPMPAANYNVEGYEVDAWWETERFGVELDVYATHGSPHSFEEDRHRQDDLLAAGVEITRITDVRLEEEPDAVMERLRSHLARRRRELAAYFGRSPGSP
jgi:very-short-patch-repair endonuclease